MAAMQLFTHRLDVDQLNRDELEALPGESVRFEAQDSGTSPDALKAGCPVSASRHLQQNVALCFHMLMCYVMPFTEHVLFDYH